MKCNSNPTKLISENQIVWHPIATCMVVLVDLIINLITIKKKKKKKRDRGNYYWRGDQVVSRRVMSHQTDCILK